MVFAQRRGVQRKGIARPLFFSLVGLCESSFSADSLHNPRLRSKAKKAAVSG
jgi:hypothetical protein